MRLLIVEDEMLIALSLELLVTELGHTVCGMATSAPAAVGAAADCRPDVVLMDIRLADGSDGITAAREIRQRFGIPAIYVSASLDRHTVERAWATRPLGFLHKPFSAQDVQRILALATDHLAPKTADPIRVVGFQNFGKPKR